MLTFGGEQIDQRGLVKPPSGAKFATNEGFPAVS